MLTYADAKALLDKSRNSRNGVAHPAKRIGRIFWEDDDNPRNRNIVVYQWQGGRRLSYGERRTSMEERRKTADEERTKQVNDGRRYYYGGHQPIVTLFPNGNYMVWTEESLHYRNTYDILRLTLPDPVAWTFKVVLPTAGPKPKLRKIPTVSTPRYVAKNGWPCTKESREKARADYEVNVAKHGSLEDWFEAHAKAEQIRESNERKLDEWRSKQYTRKIWSGCVFNSEGQATVTSWKHEKGRRARKKREKEQAERKARLEVQRKKRAWARMLKVGDVKKIYDSLNEDMQTYLRLRGVMPEPDGTVVLMKFVREDYASGYDPSVVYKPGATIEDANFQPTDRCGNGLHFAATIDDCERWSGRHLSRSKQILCKVDLRDAVVVGVYPDYPYDEEKRFQGVKVKARKCVVLGEGDGTDSRTLAAKPKRKIAPKKSSTQPRRRTR